MRKHRIIVPNLIKKHRFGTIIPYYCNENHKKLERFFDTVNHSRLIELLSHCARDGRVESLFTAI